MTREEACRFVADLRRRRHNNRENRRADAARPCYCDSGKKYRNCHEPYERLFIAELRQEAEIASAEMPAWGAP